MPEREVAEAETLLWHLVDSLGGEVTIQMPTKWRCGGLVVTYSADEVTLIADTEEPGHATR